MQYKKQIELFHIVIDLEGKKSITNFSLLIEEKNFF